MSHRFKYLVPAIVISLLLANTALSQVSSPNYWKANSASSIISPINPALQVPCANIVGGCGAGGGASTSTSNTWGGTQSFATATAQSFNTVLYIPTNFATAGAFGSSTLTDFGSVVNYAYSLANASSVAIMVPTITVTQAQWKTPIVFGSNYKAPNLICPGGAQLMYGGTSTAVTFNFGNPTGHLVSQDYGCTYMGSSTLIAAAQTSAATTTGVAFGGSNGAVFVDFHDNNINGFGHDVTTGANTYMFTFAHNTVSGGANNATGSLIYIAPASNSGERFIFDGNSFTDPANSSSNNAIYISDSGLADGFFTNNSFDDAHIYIGISNGTVNIIGNHFENAAFATYKMIQFITASSSGATDLNVEDNMFALDNTGATGKLSQGIEHAVNLVFNNNMVDNYGGASAITNFIDHSINPGQAMETACSDWSQNSAVTNWMQLTSTGAGSTQYPGCYYEIQNGYPFNFSVDGGGRVYLYEAGALATEWDTAQDFSNAGKGVFGSTAVASTTIQGTGASSTVRVGMTANASHGCYELYDSVNSSTLEYIYTTSGALAATTTKPSFCQ